MKRKIWSRDPKRIARAPFRRAIALKVRDKRNLSAAMFIGDRAALRLDIALKQARGR